MGKEYGWIEEEKTYTGTERCNVIIDVEKHYANTPAMQT